MNDLATGEKRPHPLVGTVVEPYAILDVIAAGGMGVVFKARHMLTDRIVAMKLLPSELARDESNVQRVKLEAKALAQLNHPNIVTTFDFGFTYMQEPFIVMEYVAGQSLKEVLDREVLLPVDRAVKIFLQAVDGMRYAHSAKILHRDLKPHNIMVSDEPEPDHVKILDFGVAKFAEYTQQITRTGEVVGSPLYMSPEQCTGRPTDHRCDIYSIGVMMFETLTGNPPFRGENYISTVHLKCTKLAPNFRDVVPGRVFPDRLEMIVLKCLEIEPDKRYANMSELRADLELVAGVVPKVDRAKGGQALASPAAVAAKASAESAKRGASSPGPGEIGWKPAWSGNNDAPNVVSRTETDNWSDSIVTGTEPGAWQSPAPSYANQNNAQTQPSHGQALQSYSPGVQAHNQGSAAPQLQNQAQQQSPSPFQSAQHPAQNFGSANPGSNQNSPPPNQSTGVKSDTWRDMSSPSVADDSWRGPSSPNLSADDWSNLDSHQSTGLTGQWPASPTPNLLKPATPPPAVPQQAKGVAAPTTMQPVPPTTVPPALVVPSYTPPQQSSESSSYPGQAQDMASLSAALEASSVSGPAPITVGTVPADPNQSTGTQSQVITGDHPTVQVGSNTVPVPKPNKEAADSHFVLTWDSKSGPAWSATTAAPQKPRGPTPHATNTRNPVQAPTPELLARNAGHQQQQAIAQSAPADVQSQSLAGQNTAGQQPSTSPNSGAPAESTQQQQANQTTSPPAWAQAPPSGQQPSPWDGTTSGVVNPASAYGWRPADAELPPQQPPAQDGFAQSQQTQSHPGGQSQPHHDVPGQQSNASGQPVQNGFSQSSSNAPGQPNQSGFAQSSSNAPGQPPQDAFGQSISNPPGQPHQNAHGQSSSNAPGQQQQNGFGQSNSNAPGQPHPNSLGQSTSNAPVQPHPNSLGQSTSNAPVQPHPNPFSQSTSNAPVHAQSNSSSGFPDHSSTATDQVSQFPPVASSLSPQQSHPGLQTGGQSAEFMPPPPPPRQSANAHNNSNVPQDIGLSPRPYNQPPSAVRGSTSHPGSNSNAEPSHGEPDPWSDLPTASSNKASSRDEQGPWGAPPNTVAHNSSHPPQFSPAPGPWGPQPLASDFVNDDRTVAVNRPGSGPPSSTSTNPFGNANTGTISGVMANPFQTPQAANTGQLSSPIHQLAQRVTEGLPHDSSDDTYGDDDGAEFKNYEPVSLAELNAIKTPIAKPAPKSAVDSGLSTILPATPPTPSIPTPKSRNRFSDADEESDPGGRAHAASLRFSTSRGGNDGKKLVMISLVGVALLAIFAAVGYIVYSHGESSKKQASIQEQPATTQSTQTTDSSTDSSPKNASSESTPGTTSDTTTTPISKPVKTAKTSPPSTKKKAVAAVKPKKPKKVKAIAKEPASSPDVPATPRRRRAYSTYDSYYGN